MFCPDCGTQNVESNKFCVKCGKSLAGVPLPAVSSSPDQISPPSRPAGAATDPLGSARLYGGIAGLGGGAMGIVGWLLPWSNAVIVSISGLQITISGFTAGLAGLGLARQSSASWILVCLGLFIGVVFGAIPVLGILCLRSGLRAFENRPAHADESRISSELEKLRSRSIKGIVLVAAIFLVPLVFSAILSTAMPGWSLLGQVGNLLPNSGYGSGFFVTAGGFVLAYIGARLAKSQITR
jgi:hypothetical protein